MKKFYAITFLFLSGGIALRAQQDLTVTSSAADTKEVGGIEYTWTLGEIVIDEVFLDTTVVTQGFHQGNLPFAVPKKGNNGTSVSTVITPGVLDGRNDKLRFPILESVPNSSDNDIIIFNRWGQVVYKVNDYQNDWEGTNQNGSNLPEGTYYFVLSMRVEGLPAAIHGNVLVIR